MRQLSFLGRLGIILIGGWMVGLVGAMIVGTVFSIATAGEATVVGGAIGAFGGMALTIILGWKWVKSG